MMNFWAIVFSLVHVHANIVTTLQSTTSAYDISTEPQFRISTLELPNVSSAIFDSTIDSIVTTIPTDIGIESTLIATSNMQTEFTNMIHQMTTSSVSITSTVTTRNTGRNLLRHRRGRGHLNRNRQNRQRHEAARLRARNRRHSRRRALQARLENIGIDFFSGETNSFQRQMQEAMDSMGKEIEQAIQESHRHQTQDNSENYNCFNGNINASVPLLSLNGSVTNVSRNELGTQFVFTDGKKMFVPISKEPVIYRIGQIDYVLNGGISIYSY